MLSETYDHWSVAVLTLLHIDHKILVNKGERGEGIRASHPVASELVNFLKPNLEQ